MTRRDTFSQPGALTQLRRAGLSVTVPRLAVLRVIEESAEMIDAAQVQRRLLEQDADMALATVYSVLNALHRAGLLARHHYGQSRAVYGPIRGQCPSRLMCSRCGRIQWVDDPRVLALIEEICQTHGFELSDYTLSVHVACQPGRCARSGQ